MRKKIDHTVLEMLKLTDATTPAIIDTLRWLWCNESSAHGQNQKVRVLLKTGNVILDRLIRFLI